MTQHAPKAAEVANAAPGTLPTAERVAVQVSPTQVRRPWRSTARTVFQALVGLCVLAPVLVGATGLDVEQLPWLVVLLGVAAAVTRIMALPQVEDFLRRFLPFLAAAPAPAARRDERGATTVQGVSAALLILTAAAALLALASVAR